MVSARERDNPYSMCLVPRPTYYAYIVHVGFLCLHLPTKSTKFTVDQCADLTRILL